MAHAKLSPSGAARWMRCPGSVVLEANFPDSSTAAADEGTAAHWLASVVLDDKTEAHDYIGEKIRVGAREFTVDKNMAKYVQDYADYVREEAEGGVLLVEQKVPIGHITGEEGAEGTSDAVIILGRLVKIIDLKYGMGVKVEAANNEQGALYGLGTIEKLSLLHEFDEIEIHIHMPRLERVTVWKLSVAELEAFGEEAARAAIHVSEAAADAESCAPALTERFQRKYLQAGEKQCRFCRAKSTCPAYVAEIAPVLVGEVASADEFAAALADSDGHEAVDADTGDNFLSICMSKVDTVEQWCKAVRAEVERRLTANIPVDGFKLVQGKRGPRKWANEAEAETTLKSFRLKQDEMYDRSLISPTTANKIFKDDPKRWAKLEKHITQSEGKLSVAPASDPRSAVTVTATAEDFAELL